MERSWVLLNKIWLTSDTHFGHSKSFLFSPRGYESIEEHDKDLIRIWNETVSPDDTVYHLGDVMLNDNDHGMECLRSLNGNIKIIRGNHDTNARIELYQNLPNVEVLGYATAIRHKKYNIYLSHYSTRTSNYDDGVSLHRKVLSFCGHSHTPDRFADWDNVGAYHVEWDAHGRPVDLDTAISEIKDKISGYYESDYLMSTSTLTIDLTTPINPAAPILSMWARCNKCVYSWPMCGSNDSLGNCISYKKDAPDEGYYG